MGSKFDDPWPYVVKPVDFEASKVLICNKTCSGVINGIVNRVFVGTLLSTKSLILLVSKSNELPDDVFSFKCSATEAKYLFSLLATASDSGIQEYTLFFLIFFSKT